MLFFHSFSYRGKVIIKDICISQRSIIVSPLSRDSTVGTRDAVVFRLISDLIPFHVFLILFQFLSKYFSIISVFTFLHKGGEYGVRCVILKSFSK